MTRLLLEASAARRPGNDRGIGRYLAAVRAANTDLGHEVTEIAYDMGEGRLSELWAVPHRQIDLLRRGYDVFHSPTPYYMGWAPPSRRRVVSILDVIPLEVQGHAKTGAKARLFHHWAATSDCVLTLSQHAAGRITALLGVPPTRVVVAPLPPAADFTADGPTAGGLPSRYVAALADLRTPDPRKRAHWLTSIAERLAHTGVSVVVAGNGTKDLASPGLVGVGRVDDARWAAILRGAELLVYTSAYEGQGMPPLESLACDTPVVAMDNSAVPEVVGRAGVLVPEATTDGASCRALAAACESVLQDPSRVERLRDACAEQAGTFTRQRFVNALGAAYTPHRQQARP